MNTFSKKRKVFSVSSPQFWQLMKLDDFSCLKLKIVARIQRVYVSICQKQMFSLEFNFAEIPSRNYCAATKLTTLATFLFIKNLVRHEYSFEKACNLQFTSPVRHQFA